MSARIGATGWETSLMLPVEQVVRTRVRVAEGDTVTVTVRVAPRGGRAADGTGPTV